MIDIEKKNKNLTEQRMHAYYKALKQMKENVKKQKKESK